MFKTMCYSLTATTCAALAASAQATVISEVTTAGTIDPAGGAAIAYENANWAGKGDLGFRSQAAATGGFTKTSSTAILSMRGVQVLDFESDHGFATASQTLASNGKVFTSTSSMNPYASSDAITGITLNNGYSIGVSYQAYNSTTAQLSTPANSGVFLVGDRSATPYVMTSGTRGLTGGPSSAAFQGILLSFESDLSAFSCVMNTGNTSGGPVYYVLLLDQASHVIGSYYMPASQNVSLYFGVTSSTSEIRSVWIGQVNAVGGIVVDDVAFVPVPEPAALGILSVGCVLTLSLTRRTKVSQSL